jgi:hypothetical protein
VAISELEHQIEILFRERELLSLQQQILIDERKLEKLRVEYEELEKELENEKTK